MFASYTYVPEAFEEDMRVGEPRRIVPKSQFAKVDRRLGRAVRGGHGIRQEFATKKIAGREFNVAVITPVDEMIHVAYPLVTLDELPAPDPQIEYDAMIGDEFERAIDEPLVTAGSGYGTDYCDREDRRESRPETVAEFLDLFLKKGEDGVIDGFHRAFGPDGRNAFLVALRIYARLHGKLSLAVTRSIMRYYAVRTGPEKYIPREKKLAARVLRVIS